MDFMITIIYILDDALLLCNKTVINEWMVCDFSLMGYGEEAPYYTGIKSYQKRPMQHCASDVVCRNI